MEFYKSKLGGCEVTIVFTGPRYYFFDQFHGWIAMATRETPSEMIGENNEIFDLYVGNHHCVGSTIFGNERVAAFCKRQINRFDGKYVSKRITYNVIERDLAKMQVELIDNFNDLK